MLQPSDILADLRLAHKLTAGELMARLRVSRATVTRALVSLGDAVVTRGQARRTAYAARRPLRGETETIPLFRIDRDGAGTQIAALDPIYRQGCALQFMDDFEWPLIGEMADGWFEGLPYPLDDLRPQGFLGRQFARRNAGVLQVPEDPLRWSEDDTLHALSVLGEDLPGNYILGAAAYRRYLDHAQEEPHFLSDKEVGAAYQARAEEALVNGVVGSSAGGDFPKFTERRRIKGEPVHVIVKFSGSDNAPGTRRFADLLICEHLALGIVSRRLGMEASLSTLHQADGRTFLEVQRFDRHGLFGRSAVCSWFALNAALVGLGSASWSAGAAALRGQGLIDEATAQAIARLWHFGTLIANTDMHDGNLAFQPGAPDTPGLRLAPVYDMLPMHYAPVRGVELPVRKFAPPLPMPDEQAAWREAAPAAIEFWKLAAGDKRISSGFRALCAENARTVEKLAGNPVLGT